MAFRRLLAESKSEVRAEVSPIKLTEKRDTLHRFARRLSLNDSSVAELLEDDVSFRGSDARVVYGKPAVLAALFQAQRQRPHWDEASDWTVRAREWTRRGHRGGGVPLAQTFLLSDDGLRVRAIVEEEGDLPPLR